MILILITFDYGESADIVPDPTLAPVKMAASQPKLDRTLAIDITDFTIREPETVHNDFAELVNLYPVNNIYLLELGYPSSEGCNSSEIK